MNGLVPSHIWSDYSPQSREQEERSPRPFAGVDDKILESILSPILDEVDAGKPAFAPSGILSLANQDVAFDQQRGAVFSGRDYINDYGLSGDQIGLPSWSDGFASGMNVSPRSYNPGAAKPKQSLDFSTDTDDNMFMDYSLFDHSPSQQSKLDLDDFNRMLVEVGPSYAFEDVAARLENLSMKSSPKPDSRGYNSTARRTRALNPTATPFELPGARILQSQFSSGSAQSGGGYSSETSPVSALLREPLHMSSSAPESTASRDSHIAMLKQRLQQEMMEEQFRCGSAPESKFVYNDKGELVPREQFSSGANSGATDQEPRGNAATHRGTGSLTNVQEWNPAISNASGSTSTSAISQQNALAAVMGQSASSVKPKTRRVNRRKNSPTGSDDRTTSSSSSKDDLASNGSSGGSGPVNKRSENVSVPAGGGNDPSKRHAGGGDREVRTARHAAPADVHTSPKAACGEVAQSRYGCSPSSVNQVMGKNSRRVKRTSCSEQTHAPANATPAHPYPVPTGKNKAQLGGGPGNQARWGRQSMSLPQSPNVDEDDACMTWRPRCSVFCRHPPGCCPGVQGDVGARGKRGPAPGKADAKSSKKNGNNAPNVNPRVQKSFKMVGNQKVTVLHYPPRRYTRDDLLQMGRGSIALSPPNIGANGDWDSFLAASGVTPAPADDAIAGAVDVTKVEPKFHNALALARAAFPNRHPDEMERRGISMSFLRSAVEEAALSTATVGMAPGPAGASATCDESGDLGDVEIPVDSLSVQEPMQSTK